MADTLEGDIRFGFLKSEALKEKWLMARHAKFTASRIGCLLVGGSGGKLFGPGAMTYIKKKATEKMQVAWDRPDLDHVKSLRHGKMYELPAFLAYQNFTKNHSMRYFGSDDPVFLDYDNDSGGSPDGLMGEGEEIYCGLELKCPVDSEVHMDYFAMKHQYELQAYNGEYYAQMQFLLMITKAPVWHFCSFDERFEEDVFKIKVLEVKPDKQFQTNLKIRLKQAVIERDKIIDYRRSLIQAA